METGSGRAIEVAPFHSRGALKGFVISGRWPDSTKEWAQLLMVAVRVASLPGLLDTTTVFGVREELPDAPAPGTVGLVLAEGPVVGESAIQPGYFADHQPPALLMLHPPVGDHAVAAGMHWRRVGLCAAARSALSGTRAPRGLGGGRGRRHHHLDGQPSRRRPDQPPRHSNLGDAACRIASPTAGSRSYGRQGVSSDSSTALTGDLDEPSNIRLISARGTSAKPGSQPTPWRSTANRLCARLARCAGCHEQAPLAPPAKSQ